MNELLSLPQMALRLGVTQSKNPELHDRMPVFLDRSKYAPWLDPDPAALQRLLNPSPSEMMRFDLVSTHVNSPRHEGPECVRPQAVQVH